VTEDQREIKRKRQVIEYAETHRSVRLACGHFGVARSTFHLWRERFRDQGDEGLKSRRRTPHDHPNKTPPEVVEKILHLRRTYHVGPVRIVWYLERYLGIKTSAATVYRTCKRHGLNRLPNRVGRRAVHTHRYEKRVPGHHVQVDVKFLTLEQKKGGTVRRYQCTAIDDATRVRALKIYKRHTQASAIDFINYVVEKFPFRIQTIRSDRGHEFQALFHWHVHDIGMEHVSIKARTPQLNGKVGRSHGTDKEEFHQLLTYKDDVDLAKELAIWERFYNNDRPHGAHQGEDAVRSLARELRLGS